MPAHHSFRCDFNFWILKLLIIASPQGTVDSCTVDRLLQESPMFSIVDVKNAIIVFQCDYEREMNLTQLSVKDSPILGQQRDPYFRDFVEFVLTTRPATDGGGLPQNLISPLSGRPSCSRNSTPWLQASQSSTNLKIPEILPR